MQLEHDNEKCCKHYVEAIKDGSFTPLEACVGTKAFNRHMQGYLQDILKRHDYLYYPKKEIVLELMAGYGHNYTTLKMFF